MNQNGNLWTYGKVKIYQMRDIDGDSWYIYAIY